MKLKAGELRQKEVPDLEKDLLEWSRKQFELRMQASAGEFTRHTQLREARRNIACLKTILREKGRKL